MTREGGGEELVIDGGGAGDGIYGETGDGGRRG